MYNNTKKTNLTLSYTFYSLANLRKEKGQTSALNRPWCGANKETLTLAPLDFLFCFWFWDIHGYAWQCLRFTPGSVLRYNFWWVYSCLRDHMGCWGLNMGQSHTRQSPYLLYCVTHSSPYPWLPVSFIGEKFLGTAWESHHLEVQTH